MDWMFGYQAGHSFPGVLGMLHWADASYTSGCPTHYRGRYLANTTRAFRSC